MQSQILQNISRCFKARQVIAWQNHSTFLKKYEGEQKTLTYCPQTSSLNFKIDPYENPHKRYDAPSLIQLFDGFVLGQPVLSKPEIVDPREIVHPLRDPDADKKPEIKVHKHDLYWRRRGMKHHRFQRWKKRNETLLAKLKYQKSVKTALRHKLEIESIWKEAGLEKEPPSLSDEEKSSLEASWKYDGIWTEALSERKIFEFSVSPTPKNKKVLPPKRLARYSISKPESEN